MAVLARVVSLAGVVSRPVRPGSHLPAGWSRRCQAPPGARKAGIWLV